MIRLLALECMVGAQEGDPAILTHLVLPALQGDTNDTQHLSGMDGA